MLIFKEGFRIQSKFLAGGTSNKVPKLAEPTNSLRNEWLEKIGKEGREVRIDGSVRRVVCS